MSSGPSRSQGASAQERLYVPESSPAAVPSGILKPGWVGVVVTCHLLVEASGPEGGASCWPFLNVALGQTAVGC